MSSLNLKPSYLRFKAQHKLIYPNACDIVNELKQGDKK